MEKCLTFSPKRRIEVGEALRHPYLQVSPSPIPAHIFSKIPFPSQPYHDPQDEPTAEPLDPSFFDFDNGDPLGKEQLKGASYVHSNAILQLTFDPRCDQSSFMTKSCDRTAHKHRSFPLTCREAGHSGPELSFLSFFRVLLSPRSCPLTLDIMHRASATKSWAFEV